MIYTQWDDIKVGQFIKIHNPKRKKKNRIYVIEIISKFYSISFEARYMCEDITFDIYKSDVDKRKFELLTKEDYPEYFL